MHWDPSQYARFADERSRPFFELAARIGADTPRQVVDLGCGPGQLTVTLADRWTSAQIIGVDSSAEMIGQADALGDPRVRFELGDIASWDPGPETDVVISNAALQWVPGHDDLLRRWANALPAGAWLAWQVPGNFDSPSHALMREVGQSPRWRDQIGDALKFHAAQLTPDQYAQLLLEAGWVADVWQTTYTHLLAGTDPVLEWVRGTGLRPVLAALDSGDPSGGDRAEFEAEYGARLRSAYPARPFGTLFEFRRIFAVGHKP